MDGQLDDANAVVYTRKVGERLRAIRRQKKLSLQEVEARSRLEFSRAAASPDRHEVARLHWERRAKREARKAKQASATVA